MKCFYDGDEFVPLYLSIETSVICTMHINHILFLGEELVVNGEKDQEAAAERELPPAPARPAPVRPAPQRPLSSHSPSPPQGSSDRPKSVSTIIFVWKAP